jgi:hypothetical protein
MSSLTKIETLTRPPAPAPSEPALLWVWFI